MTGQKKTYREKKSKIAHTNNAAYDEAIKLVKRIKPLLARLDKPEGFGQYIALLRAKYKAKRNFMKLLDKL
ncbi:MAG: hypothetical protein A2V79_00200 [Betaproteobacteria bacterium RBG_16_56_24]|nr:MAG: hypothetical protein A2V79_00200 [Betaproteobacteria bacterium RBG_16_56_24]